MTNNAINTDHVRCLLGIVMNQRVMTDSFDSGQPNNSSLTS